MMNSILALSLGLFLLDNAGTADNGWRMESSPDGSLIAVVRGEKRKTLKRNRTVAGTIVTRINKFRDDQTEFTLCYTQLPRMAKHFANDEKLFDSARNNILKEYSAVEILFDDWKVGDFPARVLEYRVQDPSSEASNGRFGMAVVIVLDDSVYAANVLCEGNNISEHAKTFINSVKISRADEPRLVGERQIASQTSSE